MVSCAIAELEVRDLSPRKKPDPDAGKYQPTAREQAVLDKYKAQTAAENTPRIKVSQKKGTAISLDHPDGLVGYALLTEALGTVDGDFVTGLLTQLGNATSQDQRPDESASISCCPSSKAPSRKISSRPCWRHRWPPFTQPP